jgi:hypothetical protein
MIRPPVVIIRPHKMHEKLKKIQYPGMKEKGIIPIFPVMETLYLEIAGQTLKVQRSQLPLTGAYAITDYKAQGGSYEHIVADLVDVNAPATAYVEASRVTSSKGMRILRPFPKSALTTGFSQSLADAIQDLEAL